MDALKKNLSILLLTAVVGCQKPILTQEVAGDAGATSKGTGRTAATGADFMIAIIPDTQYYVWGVAPSPSGGGTPQMFSDQINWIKTHRVDSNIVYVAGLGDIVDSGEDESQWITAKNIWYGLETVSGLPDGIPYGVSVGDHDQDPHGCAIRSDGSGSTPFFNKYFGVFNSVNHFAGRSYYGAIKSGSGNDSHYDLVTAGGMDLVIIYLEFNGTASCSMSGLYTWCDGILTANPNRKAIIVSHSIIDQDGSFSGQGGQALYDQIKSRKNVMLMLNGHHCTPNASSPGHTGEAYNHSTYDGHSIKSMLSDYQHREWGGNGKMRLLKISPSNDRFSVLTYSPYTNTYESDTSSAFTRPLLYDERTSRTNDYNNNGTSEWAFFKNGVWKRQGLADVTFGVTAGNIPLTADFDGDGRTDIAVFKPSPGQWIIQSPASTTDYSQTAGDVPVPADYNGDGKADIAHWRPGTSTWYICGVGGTVYSGHTADVPVPGDYNGDGKADIALFKKDGHWFIKGQRENVDFGNSTGVPTPGDYDGDGKTDISVYNADTGTWYVEGGSGIIVVAPLSGDIPAPGDYDGDGKTDRAIYRPSTGQLFIYNQGTVATSVLGSSGYKLLNLPYHIRKYYTGFF